MTVPCVLRVSYDSLIFPPKIDVLLRTNCYMYANVRNVPRLTSEKRQNYKLLKVQTAEIKTPESTNCGYTNY